MAMQEFCTFYLGDLCFGIDVLEVQEVLRQQEVTRVPLAEAAISGLINLRGQIVTALNLRNCLELPALPPGTAGMNVIVQIGDTLVSLLVDEVGDVVEVQPESLEEAPHHLQATIHKLIRGVYQLENALMLVLNSEKLLEG